MSPQLRTVVRAARWMRLRAGLSHEIVEAANQSAVPAVVDGYRSNRPVHGDALDAALRILAKLAVDGAAAAVTQWTRHEERLTLALRGPAGAPPAELAVAARECAQHAAELSAALRVAAQRLETLEDGLTLRAEDHGRSPMAPPPYL